VNPVLDFTPEVSQGAASRGCVRKVTRLLLLVVTEARRLARQSGYSTCVPGISAVRSGNSAFSARKILFGRIKFSKRIAGAADVDRDFSESQINSCCSTTVLQDQVKRRSNIEIETRGFLWRGHRCGDASKSSGTGGTHTTVRCTTWNLEWELVRLLGPNGSRAHDRILHQPNHTLLLKISLCAPVLSNRCEKVLQLSFRNWRALCDTRQSYYENNRKQDSAHALSLCDQLNFSKRSSQHTRCAKKKLGGF